MKRINDPEIRRRQILDAAMKLFCEKGYDDTSLEDIARELHVVKSLCYRYFDCKQTLYGAVLAEYTEESCRSLVEIIHDHSLTMSERLRSVLAQLLKPAASGRWHDFFHKRGNEPVHEQLALRMCKYMLPHTAAELERSGVKNPLLTAGFLMYGLIGVWQEGEEPAAALSEQYGELAAALLRGCEEKIS